MKLCFAGKQHEKNLYVYGIVSPEGLIYPVNSDKHQVWYQFFDTSQYGGNVWHRAPYADAIRAYEAIGYRRVKFRLIEIEPDRCYLADYGYEEECSGEIVKSPCRKKKFICENHLANGCDYDE
jgi:hypothetical protein